MRRPMSHALVITPRKTTSSLLLGVICSQLACNAVLTHGG